MPDVPASKTLTDVRSSRREALGCYFSLLTAFSRARSAGGECLEGARITKAGQKTNTSRCRVLRRLSKPLVIGLILHICSKQTKTNHFLYRKRRDGRAIGDIHIAVVIGFSLPRINTVRPKLSAEGYRIIASSLELWQTLVCHGSQSDSPTNAADNFRGMDSGEQGMLSCTH